MALSYVRVRVSCAISISINGITFLTALKAWAGTYSHDTYSFSYLKTR